MHRIFLALAFCLIGGSALAEVTRVIDDTSAARKAIGVEDTIAAQMDAFLADDFDKAFTFASPLIQQKYGTVEDFGATVRGAYPMVWRPAEVLYYDQESRGSAVWQRLRITDGDGVEHWFIYEMVRIDDEWRVNGVYPTRAPELSV